MSTIFWIFVGGVFLIGIAALVWGAMNAPEGYEDEDGFHEGNPPEDKP